MLSLKALLYILSIKCAFYHCFNFGYEENYDFNVLMKYLKENNCSHPRDPFTCQQLITSEKLKNNSLEGSWKINNIYLYTRDYKNGTKFELLNPKNSSTIKNCHFKSRPTYLVIHGFLGYGLEKWILNLKKQLLLKEDCNVISIDWPAGDAWILLTYMWAADRVPVVGNNTATLLQQLIQFKGLRMSDVHCIGHSLGAHVCGFSGKPFNGSMGRISGLDPAGPLFHRLDGSQRLDKTDASFVGVMHTNACKRWPYWTDCYGINEDIGHSNFYPNGGEHQPGCSYVFPSGNIGCDHQRAYKFYTSSLEFDKSSTYFFSRPGDTWVQYLKGNCSCGKEPQYMGWNTNMELKGRFFLKTGASEPYALQDPDCDVYLGQWKGIILVSYALVAMFNLACFASVVTVVAKVFRRKLLTYANDTERLM